MQFSIGDCDQHNGGTWRQQVSVSNTAWHQTPENRNLNLHCCEKLRSQLPYLSGQ